MSKNMSNVTAFFYGNLIGNLIKDDDSMKNIESIFNYNDNQLEEDHTFIQWVFPTFRFSAFNPTAPVISSFEIKELRKDPKIIEWLTKFKIKMFTYWGLVKPDDIELGISGDIRLLNGHNGLRLSRAIECLTLFGIEVSEIFDILKENIRTGVLKPYYISFEGKSTPIWFVRYVESSRMLPQVI